jgi:3-deoxy-manno-octulosonate cytidylyltransferase (CMP-KDO synthetase)
MPAVQRHVGLYAYRVSGLKTISAAPPCALEQVEKLEQLRALWLGLRIIVATAVEPPTPHVETEEDLAKVRRIFERSPLR